MAIDFKNPDMYEWLIEPDPNPYNWKLREGAPQRIVDEFNEVVKQRKQTWDKYNGCVV